MSDVLSFDLASLRAAYTAGRCTPAEVVAEVGRRIADHGDPAVWIHRLTATELAAQAARVTARGLAAQPLYGVPFAVKDNIDVAGVPTTVGCPGFSYMPETSATVVQKLMGAGAILVGKTNLDQFATGLVGTRSPFGTPRNPFHPDMIPGGSSSGSACAVAAGLVGFALGTDTAGSGRVPAAFQNLVGLKPTRGWLSTRGVYPACRSLDCVSVFTLTVADALAVAGVAGGPDAADPFSREVPVRAWAEAAPARFRFGVPAADQCEWFGDDAQRALFEAAQRELESLGGERVAIDFAPFQAAARLLYDGPWIAERWSAVRAFHARAADAILPVTRRILEAGESVRAADAFEAFHRLAGLARQAEETWRKVDALVLPTTATIYTRAQVEAEPVALNTRLGHYTNFANLLDTAAVATPAGFRPDGVPFGLTFFGPAWSEAQLAGLAARFHHATGRTLGATRAPLPSAPAVEPKPGGVRLAVVGAHLRGQPLNSQLTSRGATLVWTGTTAPAYRLFALTATEPRKPGLVRVASGGAAVAVEVWELATEAFGSFVAAVPPPLAIGTVVLASGEPVKGFLCEPAALAGAEDITRYGGWVPYLAAGAAVAG